MDPFADPSDVAAIWRPLSDSEAELVAAWIVEASQQIRDEVQDIGGLGVDARIAAGTLSRNTVKSIAARMVRRVMMNPEGARQRSQTVDDYSEAVTIDASRSAGDMFISESEMKRLTGLRGRRAFEIDVRADPPVLQSGLVFGYSYPYTPWDVPS